jgi:hypothetical protein
MNFRFVIQPKRKLAGVVYTGESGVTSVAYTGDSTQIFFSQKLTNVGYTGESGLTGVGYTGESRLSGVTYTGESLGQLSRPANALKGTIPQKSSLGVFSTGYLEEILVLKIF